MAFTSLGAHVIGNMLAMELTVITKKLSRIAKAIGWALIQLQLNVVQGE